MSQKPGSVGTQLGDLEGAGEAAPVVVVVVAPVVVVVVATTVVVVVVVTRDGAFVGAFVS